MEKKFLKKYGVKRKKKKKCKITSFVIKQSAKKIC